MAVSVFNWSGEKLEAKEAPLVFQRAVRIPLLHQVVRQYLNNQHQGTASAKKRGEVRGGGAKPWRQKGTGRARAGSIRSPLWQGGGVIFGPKPRRYSFVMPKKMKKEALREAVTQKIKEESLIILEGTPAKIGKTKEALAILKNLNINLSCLFLFKNLDAKAVRSFRNISNLEIKNLDNINVYDVLKHEKLLITDEALRELTERLK